jgi:hypothetical protein
LQFSRKQAIFTRQIGSKQGRRYARQEPLQKTKAMAKELQQTASTSIPARQGGGQNGKALRAPAYAVELPGKPAIRRKKKEEEELKHKKPLQRKAKPGDSSIPIDPPDSPLEKEADVVAEQVVRRLSAPRDREKGLAPVGSGISRAAASTGGAALYAPAYVASGLEASRGQGQALPAPLRTQMEGVIGTDLSGVRIHTDPKAAALSEAVAAKAFTYGQDIYFNQGLYQPETVEGRRLLGHEVGHVGQQNLLGRNKKHNSFGVNGHASLLQRSAKQEIEEVTFEVSLSNFPQKLTSNNYMFYESFIYNLLIKKLEKVKLPKSWAPYIMEFRSNFKKAVFDLLLARGTQPDSIVLNVLVFKGKKIENSHIFFYLKEEKAPISDEKKRKEEEKIRLDEILERILERQRIEEREEQRKSYRFRIRTISGGEGGFIGGGVLITFELQVIRDNVPKEKVFITFTGVGLTVGAKAGGYGVSDWTEFRTTVPIKLEDFEGGGILESASIAAVGGVGGMVLYFFCNRSLDDIPTQSVVGFGGLTGLAASVSGYLGTWNIR